MEKASELKMRSKELIKTIQVCCNGNFIQNFAQLRSIVRGSAGEAKKSKKKTTISLEIHINN